MTQLSILIPVFNEVKNIRPLLARLHDSLTKAKISYDVVIVDDRSSDGSYDTAKKLAHQYPLTVLRKIGEKGKAFSILEGVKKAKSDTLIMIDGDCQYPPEAIPEMFAMRERYGVVVARRISYDGSLLRRLGSRTLAFVFGKVVLGLDSDMQSGLKLFRKSILEFVDPADITPWAIDLPLLHTAKLMGHEIGEVKIDFVARNYGESKLSLVGPTIDIAKGALKLRFKHHEPETIDPGSNSSMLGAGVKHKGRRFITHTTLHHNVSALKVITKTQRSLLLILLGVVLIGLGLNALLTAKIIVGILSFIYFLDVIFNFFLILKSLHTPPEIHASSSELEALSNQYLPMYTVLCPLYKEAHVIPQFLENIAKLNWPKNKLDVQLLLEEDDSESIEAVKHMDIPSYVRVVVVPDSQPKTKPKACNYGLNIATGEYLVIYDAEDAPAPDQLKIAYIGFQKVGPNVKCLQAKLNYYNPKQNWLTRFFTAEYSLWFDVILTGLQSIETSIPLGGTSNHFRTADLRGLEGWDPFNVTEDCDLGVRLFKRGFKTAIIDSTTLEEANSNAHNWIRQRSRWIKGYMQTYLLHMRNPIQFSKEQGIHAWLFQLTVGGKLAFILINPILWVLTISYFALNAIVGPTIEALYPSIIFYMAVTSLVFGNFMFIYYYMIGCAKREHWGLIKWVYLIPIYWLMVSIAGAMALYQLIVKPHYWEKTIHGLHLKKQVQTAVHTSVVSIDANADVFMKSPTAVRISVGELVSPLRKLFKTIPKRSIPTMIQSLIQGKFRDETLLVGATIAANVLNMVISVVMGKTLSFEDFAIFSSLMSLLYLVYIPTSAFGAAVNYKTAMVAGKHKLTHVYSLWRHYAVRGIFLAAVLIGAWVLMLPLTHGFLRSIPLFHLILFTPVIGFVLMGAITEGHLRGLLSFRYVALATIIEPISRLILVGSLMLFNIDRLVVSAVPLATGIGCLVLIGSVMYTSGRKKTALPLRELRFPWKFFSHTFLAGLSAIAFFSMDTVLAAHFLPIEEVGKYGLLGVLGKIMFFAGSLTAGFILPFVSRKEGEGLDSRKTFERLFALTAILAICAHIGVGIILPLMAPWIGGSKLMEIRIYLPLYGLGILLYTLAQTIVSYYLAKKVTVVSWMSLFLAGIQISLLWIFHDSLSEFVTVMSVIGLLNIVVFGLFHLNFKRLRIPLENITDFLDLFKRIPRSSSSLPNSDQYHILMFNWRDTRHVWMGGAEVYLQEVAKRLVQMGHNVTIFCGNDAQSPRNEVIDGVQIIRRGGQYTVYVWAAIYYLLRLRKHVDLVIDSENGIPFLTPLYIKKPIFLLIHHIHQDVFRAHLRFPLSEIAAFIEGDLMPLLYRNQRILTVSNSSKRDIVDLGLGTEDSIAVVSPGIEISAFKPSKKTTYPSAVYVGRLKPYKNLETAIRAFTIIHRKYPKAIFTIAGTGDALEDLQKLVHSLGLDQVVLFKSSVSDHEKVKLFGEAWVALQPSTVEGFGITVIEANACGTPVIASDVKGLRDSVEDKHTGILVPPKNHIKFAQAIDLLFSNSLLRSKYSAHAQTWSKQFSWKASTDKLTNLFEKEKREHILPIPAPAKAK